MFSTRMVVGLLWCVLCLCPLAATAQPDMVPDRMNELLGLLYSNDPALRVHAAQTLRNEGNPRAMGTLLTLLREPEASVRAAAALALGRRKYTPALAPLLQAAKDNEPVVRASAVRALGNLYYSSALPVIRAALRDPAPEVRAGAALVLGELQQVTRWTGGNSAAQARKAVGWDAILTALDTAAKDPDADVRAGATLTLCRLGVTTAMASLPVAIVNHDADIRMQAVQLVTPHLLQKTPALFDALLVRVREEPDQRCRERIALLLGQTRDPRVFPLLSELLASPDVPTRLVALCGLETLGDPRAGAIALPLLRDNDPQVCNRIINLISRFHPPGAEDALLAFLPDAGDQQQHIIYTLGEWRAQRAVPTLVALLEKNPREELQPAIFFALCNIGSPEVIDALLAFTPTDEMRWSYFSALANISDQRVVPKIVVVLTDPDPMISRVALPCINTVVRLGTSEQHGAVLQVHNPEVRRQFLAAFMGNGQRRLDHDLLLVALHDPVESVRSQAVFLLGDILDEDVPALLRECYQHDAANSVRVAAAAALARHPAISNNERLALARHVNRDIRKAAINVLDASVAENVPLLLAAARDADTMIRVQAIIQLRTCRDPRVVDVLLPALVGDHPFLRRAALYAISIHPTARTDTRIEAALLNIMQTEKQYGMRAAAAWTLGGSHTPRVLDALAAVLPTTHAELRLAAAVSLSQAGDRRAITALRRFLPTNFNFSPSSFNVVVAGGNMTAVPNADNPYRRENSSRAAIAALANYRDPALMLNLLLAEMQDGDYPILERQWSENPSRMYIELLADALLNQGEPAVAPMLALLRDTSPRARKLGAILWGRRYDARAVAPLQALLRDSDAGVRRQAARALRYQADPRAREALVTALADADTAVRAEAALALGNLKDTRAVPALLPLLTDHDIDVQFATGWALLRLADPAALEPLLAALPRARDAGVRTQFIRALAVLQDPRAVDALLAALDDESVEAQVAAAAGLTQMKEPRVIERLPAILTQPGLMSTNRFNSTTAMPVTAINQDLLRVIDGYHDYSPFRLLGYVAELTRAHPDPRLIEPLCALLRRDDLNGTMQVAEALCAYTDARAVEALLTVLQNEQRHGMSLVQTIAVKAATAPIGTALAAPMQAWLRAPQPQRRRVAITFFGAVKPDALEPEVRETLRALVTDDDMDVRRETAVALATLGDAQAVQALLALLHHRDIPLNIDFTTLSRLANATAREPLAALLRDPDAETRTRAAIVLGRLGDTRARAPLTALLPDALQQQGIFHTSYWRMCYLLALGYVGNEQTVNALVTHCGSDPTRQVAVLPTLLAIDCPRAREVAVKWLNGTDAEMMFVRLGWDFDPNAPIAPVQRALADPRVYQRLLAAIRIPRIVVINEAAPDQLPVYNSLEYGPTAAYLLGILGDCRAVAPLCAALDTGTPKFRATVAAALARIGDPAALPALRAAHAHAGAGLRSELEKAIADLETPSRPLP